MTCSAQAIVEEWQQLSYRTQIVRAREYVLSLNITCAEENRVIERELKTDMQILR